MRRRSVQIESKIDEALSGVVKIAVYTDGILIRHRTLAD
jgi:hypothetical protein